MRFHGFDTRLWTQSDNQKILQPSTNSCDSKDSTRYCGPSLTAKKLYSRRRIRAIPWIRHATADPVWQPENTTAVDEFVRFYGFDTLLRTQSGSQKILQPSMNSCDSMDWTRYCGSSLAARKYYSRRWIRAISWIRHGTADPVWQPENTTAVDEFVRFHGFDTIMKNREVRSIKKNKKSKRWTNHEQMKDSKVKILIIHSFYNKK